MNKIEITVQVNLILIHLKLIFKKNKKNTIHIHVDVNSASELIHSH